MGWYSPSLYTHNFPVLKGLSTRSSSLFCGSPNLSWSISEDVTRYWFEHLSAIHHGHPIDCLGAQHLGLISETKLLTSLLHPPPQGPTQPSFCLHNKDELKGLLQKWGCCCIILPTPRPHLVPCPQYTPPRADPPSSLPAILHPIFAVPVSLRRREVSQQLSFSSCVSLHLR